MGASKKIRDFMIPLNHVATITVDTTMKEAIQVLRKLYCEVQEGKCAQAGLPIVLVLDSDKQIVGTLDFKSIMDILVPEITGAFPDRIRGLWDALGVVTKFPRPQETRLSLRDRLKKNLEKPVGDIVHSLIGATSAEADVLEALMALSDNQVNLLPVYDGDQLVGVVRDSELFLKIAEVL